MALKDKFSFLTGAARRNDLAYAAAVNDVRADARVPHSIPLAWDAGVWRRADASPTLRWVVAGVCVANHPIQQGVFVGLAGEVFCMGSGDSHTESIIDGADSPSSRGPLRAARSIEGIAYAVGMGRQVYRRDAPRQWVCLDRPIRPKPGDSPFIGFDSIDGFSGSDLYAAGVFGEIWHYDGTAWTQQDSPTNLILAAVCCAGDDSVYIGGQKAVLLRGRNNVWDSVKIDAFTDDIWGLAWFKGTLYISTLFNLYLLDANDNAVPVDMGMDRAETFYHLSVADGTLWSIGQKDIMKFDGMAWTRAE